MKKQLLLGFVLTSGIIGSANAMPNLGAPPKKPDITHMTPAQAKVAMADFEKAYDQYQARWKAAAQRSEQDMHPMWNRQNSSTNAGWTQRDTAALVRGAIHEIRVEDKIASRLPLAKIMSTMAEMYQAMNPELMQLLVKGIMVSAQDISQEMDTMIKHNGNGKLTADQMIHIQAQTFRAVASFLNRVAQGLVPEQIELNAQSNQK